MKDSTFNIVLAALDRPQLDNPFLVTARFIFADNLGNENGMGIEFEDFPAVAASAINMPVKMRFLGEGIGNHAGSIPIGHITDMEIEDGPNIKRLIGTAALYADEYPDEIAYLFEAFAENKAPGVSWELAYTEAIIREGIQWLKGIITKAATFVHAPAYGKRTALLALASDSNLTDDELDVELLKLTKASSTDTGGNKVELEELKALIEELKEALSARDSEIADLKTKHESVIEENGTLKEELATIQRSARIEERARKWVEAGLTFSEDAEKANEKREFLANLEDNIFESYLSDLVAVKNATAKPSTEASASKNTDGIPKPSITDQEEEVTLDDLIKQVRALGR